MRKILYNTVLLFFIILLPARAQEYVSGLAVNKQVADASAANRFSLKSFNAQADTVPLPFFDDFSSTSIFPDQKYWTDKFAFINSQFAVNPPTIGVATLDALDQNGSLYSNASYSSFPADKLSSKFINLNFPADSNIYFSFFYQPRGLGHKPRITDSLIVQFYAPLQNQWKKVWGIPGDSLRAFRQAILPITDTAFLHNAFRFRFMNYASLPTSIDDPGRIGDNSEWNIDYVYLDKGRNSHDTILNDLALLSPLPSLLTYFESIPWAHFPNAAFELMASGKTSVYYHYYSPDPNDSIGHSRILTISSDFPVYSYTLNNYKNIYSGTSLLDEPYFENLPYEINDSALFNVLFYLDQKGVGESSIYHWNDTIRRKQVFKDYYAYDDGTAENGYGLAGSGTKNSSVACKFFSYLPDSLRAIEIYFNDVYKDANSKYFDLTVWDANTHSGTPGNILFTQSDTSFYPRFENRNHFICYVFEKPVFITDTFYIGWTQTTEGFLNVGLDVNKITSSKLFININSNWQPSSIKGSLMIHPIFGKRISTGITPVKENPEIRLYPNPASDVLYLEQENDIFQRVNLSFYDITGKLMLSAVNSGKEVNISGLGNGIYIVRIDYGHSGSIFRKLRVIK